ncbi:beta subunit of citrate lyase, partial [Meira miltonrushii]
AQDSISRSEEDDGSEQTNFARRSMLYVPGSSDKMIKKSQNSEADCIIFDLEDSVAQHRKGAARESVFHGLNAAPRPGPELAVRINPPSGDLNLASDDLDVILPSTALNTIVVPKVESIDDVIFIMEKIQYHRSSAPKNHFKKISLVLSIESANSLLQMQNIIEAFELEQEDRDMYDQVEIGALLFASEDYCASTGIIRSKSRKELHFPRAHMATIAKAYDLQAIDMVCIDYKDLEYLQEEAQEGRSFGFDGKQAIHPAQVETIQKFFTPGEKEVERAAKIKFAYEQSVEDDKGAVGFVEGESMIMIDAPMLKQADAVLAKARAAGLTIP